jgi:hypothetical protein
VTIRRAPLPPDLILPACDTPPVELGRVTRPPHPLLGAAFAAVMGGMLGAGAVATSGWLAMLAANLGAMIVLAGVAHFVERTAWRHVPVKWGCVRASRRWILVAALAALPAIFAAAFATPNPRLAGAFSASVPATLVLPIAAALGAAAWIEILARGSTFRACMGRHGFALSAVAGAGASLVAVVPFLFSTLQERSQWIAALVLEVPLSVSLAALVWRSGSILPALGVRFVLLAAMLLLAQAWPAGAAALLVWLGCRRR